jgi:hypothetical protein
MATYNRVTVDPGTETGTRTRKKLRRFRHSGAAQESFAQILEETPYIYRSEARLSDHFLKVLALDWRATVTAPDHVDEYGRPVFIPPRFRGGGRTARRAIDAMKRERFARNRRIAWALLAAD